ncbi:MAG: RpoL/Rpb11 RNA polymerase subunit family protein [Candidatus Hodarchaeales archaeon]|jgi:DNA-directed RNA polymerase subunit L
MDAKIIRREESLLEFEVGGENHTFLNLLREALKDQEGVLFAAYRFPHPLLENPIFYLRTSGIDPIEALSKAADAISEKIDTLIDIVDSKISNI